MFGKDSAVRSTETGFAFLRLLFLLFVSFPQILIWMRFQYPTLAERIDIVALDGNS